MTCVVVDECHRATGKADIVAALAHMARAKCRFRVLGLSATPGSSREAVQVAAYPQTLPCPARAKSVLYARGRPGRRPPPFAPALPCTLVCASQCMFLEATAAVHHGGQAWRFSSCGPRAHVYAAAGDLAYAHVRLTPRERAGLQRAPRARQRLRTGTAYHLALPMAQM